MLNGQINGEDKVARSTCSKAGTQDFFPASQSHNKNVQFFLLSLEKLFECNTGTPQIN